jgi:hypothetical protein
MNIMIIDGSKIPKNGFEEHTKLVEALCYKPEGRGFDSRQATEIFN